MAGPAPSSMQAIRRPWMTANFLAAKGLAEMVMATSRALALSQPAASALLSHWRQATILRPASPPDTPRTPPRTSGPDCVSAGQVVIDRDAQKTLGRWALSSAVEAADLFDFSAS